MPKEMYVKDAGVWRLVSQLSARPSGSWLQISEGHVKDGGVWRQFYEGVFTANITISASTTDYNLRTELVALGYGGISKVAVTVTINAGVTIGSTSPSNPAFDVDGGTAYPAGSTVTLINNGDIIGRGGNGGAGGNSPNNAGARGSSGGTCIKTLSAITITNNGNIFAGSGGGGGGAADTTNGGGGGGGGGDGFGSAAGGAGGTGTNAGAAGIASDAVTNPGGGGAGGGGGKGNATPGGDGGGAGTSTNTANRYGCMGIGAVNFNTTRGGDGGHRGKIIEGYDLVTFSVYGSTTTVRGSYSPFKTLPTMISEMGWSSFTKLCLDFSDPTCYNDPTLVDQTVTDLGPAGFTLSLGTTTSVDSRDPTYFFDNQEYSHFMFDSAFEEQLNYNTGTLSTLNASLRASAKILVILVATRGTQPVLTLVGSTSDLEAGWSGTTLQPKIDWCGSSTESAFDGTFTDSTSHEAESQGNVNTGKIPNIMLAYLDDVANTVTFVHTGRTTAEVVASTMAGHASQTVTDILIASDASNNNFYDGDVYAVALLQGLTATTTELETLYLKIKDRFVRS